MDGTYNETLRTGGELIVSLLGWKIQYAFSGPDQRYNWDYIIVQGFEIDAYIAAWKNNYEKYCELKKLVPSNGTYTTTGEMNMTIQIGGYFEGVCLRDYHMPLSSESEIVNIIEDYEYAKIQASKVRKMLIGL